MKRHSVLLLALTALLSSSCVIVLGDHGGKRVKGSGHRIEEERTTGEFSHVQLEIAADATVTVGPETSVVVHGDDNLVARVTTRVNGNRLEISMDDTWSYDGHLELRISTPHLESFHIDGAGDVRITGVHGDQFTADIDGAGELRADGSVREVHASIDGAGTILLDDLRAEEASVNIDGAGDIHVRATAKLVYDIDGAGTIVYYGQPRVRGDIDGAGDLIAR